MDQYHVERIGRDFIIFVGNVSILRCSTKRKAENTIAAALHLLDKRTERRAATGGLEVERRRGSVFDCLSPLEAN